MVIALDIAPTMIELGADAPAPTSRAVACTGAALPRRRLGKFFLIEYYNESAWPWIVGMSYKAVRTERAKLIHWVHKNGVDELYDLQKTRTRSRT